MADPDTAFDEQDQSEVFDEENTNLQDRDPDSEDAEQFEDLVDVYDSTARVGDADDEDSGIGEDMDDDDIVSDARDNDDDDDDLEDDDLLRGDPDALHQEDGQDDVTDVGDDDPDAADRRRSDEVELEYVGDLNDLAGATSAAQDLEAQSLSDRDLRELDYKDEFTVDDKDADAPATA